MPRWRWRAPSMMATAISTRFAGEFFRMNGNNDLAGRVAIVTGAGRNIGRAIALELAAGGAAVVVNVRSNQKGAEAVVREIESGGGQALAGIGDVADAAAVQNMVTAAVNHF